MENSQNLEFSALFKPNKNDYFLSFFVYSAIFLVAGIIYGIFAKMWIPLFVIIFFVIFSFFWRKVMYKKEEYEIFSDKIIFRSGTIFSDNSREIAFDKITQLTLRLGFWQNLLFKTGDIIVMTGASGAIRLEAMDVPNEKFLMIQEKMRNSWFHLLQDSLVQESKPHPLAIFGEIFAKISSAIIAIFYIFIANVSHTRGDFSDIFGVFSEYKIWIFSGIGVIIFGIFLSIAFHYLDLRKRIYRVFTDSIVYEEWFLTKYLSILPMEKVADSENNQSFWSKLFGLHDVIISSEGSAARVVFKNMTDGELMIKNIKYLKDAISLKSKNLQNFPENPQEIANSPENDIVGYKNQIDKNFDYDADFVASYRMNAMRTLVGMFFWIIFSIIVAAILFVTGIEAGWSFIILVVYIVFGYARQIIAIFTTKFSIEKSSIDARISFLSEQLFSFSVDKITRVDFSENPIDKLFNTITITFSSIGSARKIVFRNIKKTTDLESQILAKIGIDASENSSEISTKMNFENFLANNLFELIVFPIFFLHYFYSVFAFSRQFYEARISENFVFFRRNLIFWTRSYARLDNVKWLSATQYWWKNSGKIDFSIATGAVIIETNQNNSQYSELFSPKISIDYVENVFDFLDQTDKNLLNNPNTEFVEQKSARQSMINFLFKSSIFIVFAIILLFTAIQEPELMLLVILLLLIIAVIIAYEIFAISCVRYILDSHRIRVLSGIFYKTRKTILYEKMNFLEKNQWPIGKICKNGNLSIFTLGGDSRDMVLVDLREFEDFYKEIKSQIKK